MSENLPLSGLTVIDLSQFLSGPYASLRLMDLGARVIKIERPETGDIARTLYMSDTDIGGDSTLFHAINRNKESLALDLKSPEDLTVLRKLLSKADVLIQNFRPGVIERLGLDYHSVKAINPKLIYASISGYGKEGPWSGTPGQDLLAQSRSGIMWLTGDDTQGPVPMGLAVADILAGSAIVQGVLAGLVQRGVKGVGCHVETSLMEALIDLQFEVLTTHLNDGGRPPKRARSRNAHAYLAAPYGVYPTKNGYLAIAMTPIGDLADLLGIPALTVYRDNPKSWFTARDEIKEILSHKLKEQDTEHWLFILEPMDIWCSKVLQWDELINHEGFSSLDMLQVAEQEGGVSIRTTRSPIRINGERPITNLRAAPRVGEHSDLIRMELGI